MARAAVSAAFSYLLCFIFIAAGARSAAAAAARRSGSSGGVDAPLELQHQHQLTGRRLAGEYQFFPFINQQQQRPPSPAPNGAARPPFKAAVLRPKTAGQSPRERAQDLVGQLTLQEKLTLLHNRHREVPRLGLPAFDFLSGECGGSCRGGGR
jgi:hypothetical protein